MRNHFYFPEGERHHQKSMNTKQYNAALARHGCLQILSALSLIVLCAKRFHSIWKILEYTGKLRPSPTHRATSGGAWKKCSASWFIAESSLSTLHSPNVFYHYILHFMARFISVGLWFKMQHSLAQHLPVIPYHLGKVKTPSHLFWYNGNIVGLKIKLPGTQNLYFFVINSLGQAFELRFVSKHSNLLPS